MRIQEFFNRIFIVAGLIAIVRIFLITEEVVDKFLWNFWGWGVSLAKTSRFSADPDRDPDPGIINVIFTAAG